MIDYLYLLGLAEDNQKRYIDSEVFLSELLDMNILYFILFGRKKIRKFLMERLSE